ncbi:Cloroperoxidase [Zopfia rhizophila CBS 207.26]|uniref:Cloroperoxidase n=1 Tax=Zopfia rhizophila CBS 207.26 TaxID=1314779 RepID=A0A6A6EPN4_9PEZI|nr:Cloroperoxidase [Zopfia rhizophila CBS 207.26]
MKLSYVFSVLLAAADAQVDFSNWHPPAYGDVRGPCPALNSLANHDIIPHDGKNLSVPLLVKAINGALNLSVEMTTVVARLGLSTSSNPGSGTFNLDDLNKHGIIEHDASLSRADFSRNGDNHSFQSDVFEDFIGHFDGKQNITIPDAATARWGRVTTERGRNPVFTYGPQERFNSYVESALYFRLLADLKSGTTPVEFIKVFFEQERLPYKEGWRTPPVVIEGFTLAKDILQLALSTPEKLDTLSGRFPGGFHGII